MNVFERIAGKRVERRPVVLEALQLVVERFLLDPVRAGLGVGRIQVGEALHDDVLPVFQGDSVTFLSVRLKRLLGSLPVSCAPRQAAGSAIPRLPLSTGT